MRKYPKTRKPSGYAKCDICGKIFIARGIGTHKREAHGIIRTPTNYKSKITVVNDSITTVNDDITTVNFPTKNSVLNNPPLHNKVPNIKEEIMKKNKCADIAYTYTEKDLWILYGNLRMVFYSQFYPPHIMRERLIKDFENRFNCKFSDVEQANTHLHPKETFSKNPELARTYASMKYSR